MSEAVYSSPESASSIPLIKKRSPWLEFVIGVWRKKLYIVNVLTAPMNLKKVFGLMIVINGHHLFPIAHAFSADVYPGIKKRI